MVVEPRTKEKKTENQNQMETSIKIKKIVTENVPIEH